MLHSRASSLEAFESVFVCPVRSERAAFDCPPFRRRGVFSARQEAEPFIRTGQHVIRFSNTFPALPNPLPSLERVADRRKNRSGWEPSKQEQFSVSHLKRRAPTAPPRGVLSLSPGTKTLITHICEEFCKR
jgi:hypothetical protein